MVEWERYCYIRQIINSFSDHPIFENNFFMHRNNHAIFFGPLKNHQFDNFLNPTEKKLKQPLFCYPLFRNFICNESSQNEPTSLPGWAWLTWDSVMWSTFGHQLLYYRTLQFTVFSSRPKLSLQLQRQKEDESPHAQILITIRNIPICMCIPVRANCAKTVVRNHDERTSKHRILNPSNPQRAGSLKPIKWWQLNNPEIISCTAVKALGELLFRNSSEATSASLAELFHFYELGIVRTQKLHAQYREQCSLEPHASCVWPEN